MGFGNFMEKATGVFFKSMDIMTGMADNMARKIDRLDDDELEARYHKPAREVREMADDMRDQKDRWEMAKEMREMELAKKDR